MVTPFEDIALRYAETVGFTRVTSALFAFLPYSGSIINRLL